MPYPRHVPAHAEPSSPIYHVYCPACSTWVGGAVAHAIGLELWAITCPHCASRAPGQLNPGTVLPYGPYSGRAVSSLSTDAGRDYLADLLLTLAPVPGSSSVPPQGLRLAILWHLGWLSAERALVAAGPDLHRLRADWAQEQGPTESVPGESEAEKARAKTRAQRQNSWVRQMQAEQERLRAGQPRRQQQFHRYQRPLSPPPPVMAHAGVDPEPRPAWVSVLGVPWPATADQVRRAYRRLGKRNHPDVGGSEDGMQKINQAHDEAQKWLGLACR